MNGEKKESKSTPEGVSSPIVRQFNKKSKDPFIKGILDINRDPLGELSENPNPNKKPLSPNSK